MAIRQPCDRQRHARAGGWNGRRGPSSGGTDGEPVTIKTLLVDDEPMARRKLQRFLRDEPDFVVVGEAENPKDAAGQIRATGPDLVFLDIVMPGGEGFDALDGLDRKELPHIVFVTAFDAHAVRAFDIQAVDYLLKPFDRRRFRQTLAKVRRSVESADARERLAALLDQRRVEQENPDRLLVRDGDRLVLVPFRSIDRVESQGNYLKLYAGARFLCGPGNDETPAHPSP